uniref:RING-type E3 ubiquitin transferase n=1 Tax=Calidris pygmaea TaxID=425635 RepID=A0A8C3JKW7_9CHAR
MCVSVGALSGCPHPFWVIRLRAGPSAGWRRQLTSFSEGDDHQQASPVELCPICLDTISNEASISICGHIFCFNCILEWSRISAVCPICRQPFHHLYHKVGPSNYEVYHITAPGALTAALQCLWEDSEGLFKMV